MTSTYGLSTGVKDSLYALQNITTQINTANNILATGKKVNSALDNPLSYFLASGFTTKANNLNNVLDQIGLTINVITQANDAITSIQSSINQALGTLQNALNTSGTNASLTTSVGFKDSSGNAVTSATAATTLLADPSQGNIDALQVGDVLKINLQTVNATGLASTIATGTSFTVTSTSTVQNLLDAINNDTYLNPTGAAPVVHAELTQSGNIEIESAVNGQEAGTYTTTTYALQVGLDTTARTGSALAIAGNDIDSVFNFSGGTGNQATVAAVGTSTTNYTGTIVGGDTEQATRAAAAASFQTVLAQINQTAQDAGYNGTNLLGGDSLTTATNDTGTSSIVTQGQTISSQSLGFKSNVPGTGTGFSAIQTAAGDSVHDFQSNNEIQSAITKLNAALATTTSLSTDISTQFNVLQNRQTFDTSWVQNLTNGSDTLTEADVNAEGATLSSLQTKQQLAVQALSLANRSDQSVLRLFG